MNSSGCGSPPAPALGVIISLLTLLYFGKLAIEVEAEVEAEEGEWE